MKTPELLFLLFPFLIGCSSTKETVASANEFSVAEYECEYIETKKASDLLLFQCFSDSEEAALPFLVDLGDFPFLEFTIIGVPDSSDIRLTKRDEWADQPVDTFSIQWELADIHDDSDTLGTYYRKISLPDTKAAQSTQTDTSAVKSSQVDARAEQTVEAETTETDRVESDKADTTTTSADTLEVESVNELMEEGMSLEGESQDTSQTEPERKKVRVLKIDFETTVRYPQTSVVYQVKADRWSASLDLDIPGAIITGFYEQQVLVELPNVLEKSGFEDALVFLTESHELHQSKAFMDTAKKLVENRAMSYQEKKRHPGSLVDQVARSFLSEADKDWLHAMRIRLFEDYLDQISDEDNMLAEQIAGFEQLYEWTNNHAYQLAILEIKTAAAYKSDDIWKSINYLQQSADIAGEHEEDTNAYLEQIRDILPEAMKKDHQQRRYDDVFEYGTRYHEYFFSNFSLRYIYAVSTERRQRYEIWIRELEWLLNNFEPTQQMIDRNELLVLLNRAYQAGMQFDRALQTNRRLYLEDREQEILDLFIVNLRARMLQPILAATEVYLDDYQSAADVKDLQDRITFYERNYLDGIFLADRNGQDVLGIYRKEGVRLGIDSETSIQMGSAMFDFDSDRQKAWFIKPWNEYFFVIQMDIRASETELSYLRDIQSNPLLANKWSDYMALVELSGAIASANVIAAMIENGPYLRGENRLRGFADAVVDNTSASYLYIYGPHADMFHKSSGYTQNISDSEQWSTSLSKSVLYHQVLRVGDDQVLDITVPIIPSQEKKGVIKLGFTRMQ
ncbi:hypothetical protein QLX67_04165 [Balneolaceae bacterium ANBcel3]|nr:hypothetical protein [Balneolaceae bacterium ANBcel3]